jgi:hypothetical protein
MDFAVGWLRLEGLAVSALSAILYARTGASWWLFAALWLVPDLSMAGYLVSPRWGAYAYNTLHFYLLPGAVSIAALLFHWNAAWPFVLIWFNHIGTDRLLGYGLKSTEGFKYTHLKHPGNAVRG